MPVRTGRVATDSTRAGRRDSCFGYIRPALGIEVDELLNVRLTAATGIAGIYVLRVTPGSAAAKAGLVGIKMGPDGVVAGDIITAVEGKVVDSVPKLLARLDDYEVGDTIKISVRRGEQTREVDVTLQPGV